MEWCSNCRLFFTKPAYPQVSQCPSCYPTFVPSNNSYAVPAANRYNDYPLNCSPAGNVYQHWSPYSPHGKKRAVVIGVSYNYQQRRVKGSVNDARSMTSFLNRLGFPNESIWVLTEEESNPLRIPTKYNIRMAMRWLVQGCQSGDSLFFFFSGYGSQEHDRDGDEIDGFDEALCPTDYATEGKILDDEINGTLVRPLPTGAKLHAVIDASSSGTFLDLPFVCKMDQQGFHDWEDHRISAIYKGTRGGIARCFSACADHESALDIKACTDDYVTGAMTHSFIQAMENERELTYGLLLHSIRKKLFDVQKRPLGPYRVTQVPQLSSNDKFNVHTEYFMI